MPDPALTRLGFGLQASCNIADIRTALPAVAAGFEQLLVFGHTGRKLWESLGPAPDGDHPLDTFSIDCVTEFLQRSGCGDYEVLYPSPDCSIDLRGLGRELGWQFDSPLGIGIHPSYGTWFAYRVVVVAETSFAITKTVRAASPCDACGDKPCINACPVGAVGEVFDLDACVTERTRHGSACAFQCIARNACPIGGEYRYTNEQMRYHYAHSLEVLRA